MNPEDMSIKWRSSSGKEIAVKVVAGDETVYRDVIISISQPDSITLKVYRDSDQRQATISGKKSVTVKPALLSDQMSLVIDSGMKFHCVLPSLKKVLSRKI